MGLMKVITHNKGVDTYDLATAVTDSNGYYCLNWDGETRVARGVSTYQNGPYTFVYRIYEKLLPGWGNVSVEKGPNFSTLAVVPAVDIKKEGDYVSVQIGTQNGYIYANAAYHVDFYNQVLKDKSKTLKKAKHTVLNTSLLNTSTSTKPVVSLPIIESNSWEKTTPKPDSKIKTWGKKLKSKLL